ncbi:hypothetical protein RB614_37815 [Phytohabitans sp. ZYX-F-186]|uniref:DUF4352 domain-containing protein n=1 Tax=Phytohabitans maris TaxID=3071409 RepID=A0ABU0ZWC8_9ACTN|nr:hypothetical protein [Phytohabitans sp. ZYX-F-186]MDQ7910267.1 hypothetical protein [Phytohabitans sp. ZYX-F-186]
MTRNSRAPLTAAAVSLVLLAAACGSDAPVDAEPAAAASAPASTTPTTAAAPTAAATSAAPDSYKLGEKVLTTDGYVRATVLAYKQPVATGAPRPEEQAGFEWGAAQIQVCAASATPVGVSSGPWKLVYADGDQLEPSSVTYVHFPQPEYPFSETTLKQGRCVKGWITFPVPAKRKPQYVEYHPEGTPLPLDWRVP